MKKRAVRSHIAKELEALESRIAGHFDALSRDERKFRDRMGRLEKRFEEFQMAVIKYRNGDNKALDQFSAAIGDLRVRLSVLETAKPRRRKSGSSKAQETA